MAAKDIIFDTDVRENMIEGIDKLSRSVEVTLGPRGRNVVIEKGFGAPTITKDGVTVAKEIDLEERFENMGAQLVKEVASKTSDEAGDGTTTATLLAEAIFQEGSKLVAAGHNPMSIKRGIDKAVDEVVDYIRDIATEAAPASSPSRRPRVSTTSSNSSRAWSSTAATSRRTS